MALRKGTRLVFLVAGAVLVGLALHAACLVGHVVVLGSGESIARIDVSFDRAVDVKCAKREIEASYPSTTFVHPEYLNVVFWGDPHDETRAVTSSFEFHDGHMLLFPSFWEQEPPGGYEIFVRRETATLISNIADHCQLGDWSASCELTAGSRAGPCPVPRVSDVVLMRDR